MIFFCVLCLSACVCVEERGEERRGEEKVDLCVRARVCTFLARFLILN